MSNIKSIAGASVWMLVSTLLLFSALEPVSITEHPGLQSAAVARDGAQSSTRA